MLKRASDVFLSFLGIVLFLPLLLLISILIKIESRGPIFYRQTRIGKGGRPFSMLKFRTMMEVADWQGPSVSPVNDPRVTGLGAILRRVKLNEFPQLFNVLKGEMSFVGPRPEVPEFVQFYGEYEREVLSVRPGIVGPTQIRMRNEEELYPEGVDPRQYYVDHILPKKLEIDREYVRDRSFLRDLGYLMQGIGVTISGAITRRHVFENAEQITLFFCDAFLCAVSYFLAYFLRMEGQLRGIDEDIIIKTMPYVVVARMLVLTYSGLYGSLIRFFSFYELGKIFKGVTVGSVCIILLTFLAGERSHPRSAFVIDWFILMFLLTGYRLSFKSIGGRLGPRESAGKKNILIYGAENMGDLALRYLEMEGTRNVVAFIDDDPRKMRKRFQGLKILGNRYDIEALARLYQIEEILVAVQNVGSEDLQHIKSLCEKANVNCEVFALAN
jgi:lipopolysaccharide/colanic/teichoic acid biosynthesis glycosyltransferase